MFEQSIRLPLDDGRELVVQYQGEDYGWGAYVPGESKPVAAAGTPFGAIVKYLNPRGGVPSWVRKVSDSLLRELHEAPRHACDCCGYLTLLHRGYYDICAVCGWEDDPYDGPDAISGPNHISLTEARTNFAAFGAAKERTRYSVRAPRPEEHPARAV
jgi:hypothetical protein